MLKKLTYLILVLAIAAIIFFTFTHLSSDRSEEMTKDLSSETASPSPEIPAEEPLTTQLLVETILPEAAEVTLNEAPIEEALTEEVAAEESLPEQTPEIVGEIQEELLGNKSNDLNDWALIVAVTFFLTLICLLTATILLLREVRWRKRRGKNEWVVFPDAHIDVLEKLEASWHVLNSSLKNFGASSLSIQKESESLAIKTIESIARFNTTIDAQKDEIDRLKDGYDFSIKKHSISALIEINDLVTSILAEELADETREKLTKVDAYIQSNLEELDVEEFKLDEGISIRDLSSDEFEIDSSEAIDRDDLHEKIKETVKNGYAFIHPNGRNVIRKAKVKVYKKEVKDG
jgi:hypothetical protein